jgi:hypothetical protein
MPLKSLVTRISTSAQSSIQSFAPFNDAPRISHLECVAGTTGLETATSAVAGQYSGVTYKK